jgi:hypothetical protein
VLRDGAVRNNLRHYLEVERYGLPADYREMLDVPGTRIRARPATHTSSLGSSPRGERLSEDPERDLIHEVGSEPDVLDPHYGNGVVEVVEPARKRRSLRLDDEGEAHHAEYAAALG